MADQSHQNESKAAGAARGEKETETKGTSNEELHVSKAAPSAYVRNDKLDRIEVRSRSLEELQPSDFHPVIERLYLLHGYDQLPRSREEAQSEGRDEWNGKAVACTGIETEGNIAKVDLQSAPYGLRSVIADAVSEGLISSEELQAHLALICGVSLLTFVEVDKQIYLVGQIKGNALGKGQFHAALSAGGLQPKDLEAENPLLSALSSELNEEIGIDITRMNPSSFKMIIDESALGMVNFVSFARRANGEEVIERFLRRAAEQDDEVAGIGAVSVPQGLTLVPLESGRFGFSEVLTVTKNGVTKMPIEARPYTITLARHFEAPGVSDFYMKQAKLKD